VTHILQTLQGTRVRLRMPAAADVPALFAIYSDPQVMRYWSNAPYATIEQAQAKFAELDRGNRAGEFFSWAIADNREDAMLGTCSLFEISQPHRRASLGYALGSVNWGNGYALEASRLAIEYAFGTMQLHRLEADVDPRNTPSLRLLDRLGFAREGVLRERWHVAGETQDSLICGLLARDYAATASGSSIAALSTPA
jgi:RimJ/RimL family protein N-acetyltransferase